MMATAGSPILPEKLTLEDDAWWTVRVPVPTLGTGRTAVLAERRAPVETPQAAADLMNRCLDALDRALPVALEAILEDERRLRASDDMRAVHGEHLDELLPEIGSVAQLVPLLREPQLFCHGNPADPVAVGLGFAFDVPWDAEHGTSAVVAVRGDEVRLTEAGGPMASYSPFD